MPQSKKQTTYNTNDKIPENMKCPVCIELLLPPIYQCEVGHNICHSCIENVQQCPLCKADYADTRNYFAEELVNTSTFPCKYEEFGCSELFHGSELKAHQDGCNYKPYRCPELGCKETSGQQQMCSHLDRHGFKIVDGETLLATIDVQDGHFDKKTEYNPWRISAFSREFYAVTARQKEGFWYFWTWILGLPEEAKKYSVEISLMSDSKDVVHRGPVHSLRVPAEDVIKSGSCLVVGDSLIKSLRKDGQITFGVRLIQGKNWVAKKTKVSKKSVFKAEKQACKKIKKISVDQNGNETGGGKVKTPSLQPNSLVIAQNMIIRNSSFTTKPIARPKSAGSKPTGSEASPNVKLLKSSKPGGPRSRPKTSVASVGVAGHSGTGVAGVVRVKKVRKSLVEDSELIKKLQESLRCPGCLQIITPPVFQCCVGHNICSTCKNRRVDCPLCRAPLESTRNFFAEELLYTSYQKCQFHTSGCKVCLPCVAIRQHESICEHAPFECPFDTCYQKFSGKELVDHLQTHRIGVSPREFTSEITFPKPPSNPGSALCAIPGIIQYNNIGFYPTIFREKDGSWAFWVTSHDHRNYQYEIVIRKQMRILAFHGPVVSLRQSHFQIKTSGACLITHDRFLKTMKTPNGKLEISVRVISTEGKSKLPESFAFPLYFDDWSSTDKETMKLFASSKTSENPEDDSDDEDNTLEGILNAMAGNTNSTGGRGREEGNSQGPYLITTISTDANGRAVLGSDAILLQEQEQDDQTSSGSSSSSSSNEASPEFVTPSGSELEVDADGGTWAVADATPTPPTPTQQHDSATDIAALTEVLLTCESNSMFLKQKYRDEHLERVQRLRLFMDFVNEELARPTEERTSEQNVQAKKILNCFRRADQEVAKLEGPEWVHVSSNSCLLVGGRNSSTQHLLSEACRKLKESAGRTFSKQNVTVTATPPVTGAASQSLETLTLDDNSLKVKKSCLKLSAEADSCETLNLTPSRSKQQLRVTFADEFPEHFEPEPTEEDCVDTVATSAHQSSEDAHLVPLGESFTLILSSPEQAFAGASALPEPEPWNAESNLTEARVQKQAKKHRKKSKSRNKRLKIAKKKAQVSFQNQEATETDCDQAAEAEKITNDNITRIENALVDENNNTIKLQKNITSLSKGSMSPFLNNLEANVPQPLGQADALVYQIPEIELPSSLQKDSSPNPIATAQRRVPLRTRRSRSPSPATREHDDEEESVGSEEELNENYDSLHSLCLAQGVIQQNQSQTSVNLDFSQGLLQAPVLIEFPSQGPEYLDLVRSDSMTQTMMFEEADQSCQVGNSLMQIGEGQPRPASCEGEEDAAESESELDPIAEAQEDVPDYGQDDIREGASFALTITRSLADISGGIYSTTKDVVKALFTGYDNEDVVGDEIAAASESDTDEEYDQFDTNHSY